MIRIGKPGLGVKLEWHASDNFAGVTREHRSAARIRENRLHAAIRRLAFKRISP